MLISILFDALNKKEKNFLKSYQISTLSAFLLNEGLNVYTLNTIDNIYSTFAA